MENQGAEADAQSMKNRALLDGVVGASMPLVLAVFALHIGSFPGGGKSSSVLTALALAVGVAGLGAWRSGVDPLGGNLEGKIGKSRRAIGGSALSMCSLLLVGLLGVSRELSPVPRAGLLWPTTFLLGLFAVAAVAWTLDRRSRRDSARRVLVGTLFVVSVWAVADWLGGAPRPAAPLGHHNLLAIWIVIGWPLALLPGRIRTTRATAGIRGSDGKIGQLRQVVDGATLATAALALLASRSLAGNLAFGLQLLWVARASTAPGRARRVGNFGLLGLAMVLAVGWRRLGSLVSGGADQSFSSRWEYAVAAWSGWLERPIWGWGPGSSAWTLHLHLDAFSLAPGQVVTDAHALALDLLYEWGLIFVLSLGLIAWLWWRTRGHGLYGVDSAEVQGWQTASTTSVLGLAVLAGCAGFFDVTALWVLLPFVFGCRLAVARAAGSVGVSNPRTVPRLVALAMVAVAVWPVLDSVRAHRLQEMARAQASASNDPSVLLDEAMRLDSEHPQIRMEWSRVRWRADAEVASGEPAPSEAVESGLRAAENGRAMAALYLEAGARFAEWSWESDDGTRVAEIRPRALHALETACDLAPRDGLAPFVRATLEEPEVAETLVDFLARALLAEPRLLVTPELLARPDLRRAAVDRVAAMSQVPVGWRAALVEAEKNLPELPSPVLEGRRLELITDGLGETSLSLFAFRRTGEPIAVAGTLIDAGRLRFEIPPVFVLREVRREGVLPFAPGCRLAFSDGPLSSALARW